MVRRPFLALCAALAGATCAALAGATLALAEPPREPAAVSLRELIERARQTYPEVAIARSARDTALATESLARALRRTPHLSGTGTFGVVPGARGSITDSPDTPRDLDDFGPFWRVRLDGSLPLYAGGRLAAGEQAARSGVAAREAALRAREDAATLLAVRAYFGYLLAEQSLDVLHEVRGHLDRLLARLEGGEEPDLERDPLDVYKARAYGFQLDRLEAKARRGLAEATIGLRELGGAALVPRAERLPRLQEAPAAQALPEALERNPELAAARRTAEARELLARAARGERLPALSLDGRFEWGRAPGRAAQDNPFVYDPWNVRALGAALALRWDLSFGRRSARLRRAVAEAGEARARSEALEVRLRAELAASDAGMTEAREVYETSRRALSTTANWLRLAEENHALGSASTKDLVDAYTAYVAARAAHFEALHDLDLAVVGWRLALGREPLVEGEDP